MTITFRITVNDLVALQKFAVRNTAFGRRVMRHRFFAVELVLAFICLVFLFGGANPLRVFAGFGLVSALAWVFRERSVLLQFKKDLKSGLRGDRNASVNREHVITVADHGMTVHTEENENRHTWDAVAMTGRDRQRVYVVMKGVVHYVIPAVAFDGDDRIEDFLAYVNSRIIAGSAATDADLPPV